MSNIVKEFLETLIKNNNEMLSLAFIETDEQCSDDECESLRKDDLWLVSQEGVIYIVLDNAFIEIGLDLKGSLLVNLNRNVEFYFEELVKHSV